MAEKDIWEAAKEGDLNTVKHLIEIEGNEVDSKDEKGGPLVIKFFFNYFFESFILFLVCLLGRRKCSFLCFSSWSYRNIVISLE